MSNFKETVLGFNSNSNIFCSNTVIVGDPNSSETGDIDIRGNGGRTVSINGVIPSSGGGGVPTDLTVNTLTATTSITNNGQQFQIGQFNCNEDIVSLAGSNKAIVADNLVARTTLTTANLVSNSSTLSGSFACTAPLASFSSGVAVTGNSNLTGNLNIDGTGVVSCVNANIESDINCRSIGCINGLEPSRSITTPRVLFRTTGGHTLIQPATGADSDNLIFRGPNATSVVMFQDDLGNTLLEVEKDVIAVTNGIELVDSATFGFGQYNFVPIQIRRELTNYVIVNTVIPLVPSAPTQIPLFVTGTAGSPTNDWTNVNTNTGSQLLADEGFYKVTLTGDSTPGASPPYLNNFACMFDFVLRTPQDNNPRVTIPIYSYSFQAMETDPTAGEIPIVTCVPGNTNWNVFINFPTFPAMTIPNLLITVTKMPY